MLAHAGHPPTPHDIWGAWNADPVLLVGLALAGWAYGRGAAGRSGEVGAWRKRCFAGAMVAVAVALVSPLDALSGAHGERDPAGTMAFAGFLLSLFFVVAVLIVGLPALVLEC